MLRIKISDIQPQGLELDVKVPGDSIALEGDELKAITAISVKAKIEKVGHTIIARSLIQSVYAGNCSRCLEPASQPWKNSYIFNFSVDPTTEFIDLSEEVRQELILNLPVRLLCAEACKGICVGCRVNLNTEECKCKTLNSKLSTNSKFKIQNPKKFT